MHLLLDLVAVLIIVSFACSAYRKGFLHTIAMLLGSLASIGVALVYSRPLATGVYSRYLKTHVVDYVLQSIEKLEEPQLAAFSQAMEQKAEELPSAIRTLLQTQVIPYMESWYEKFTSFSAVDFAEALAEAVAAPIVIAVLQVVMFSLIFGGLMILVRLFANLMRGIQYVPLVGSINALLGAVLGMIQGGLYLFVVCAVLWLVMTVAGDSLPMITPEVVDKTMIVKQFFAVGPWMNIHLGETVAGIF